MPGIKITPADKWFGYCVKERVNWTCERCGTQHERGSRGLHCSHFFGRGNHAIRYSPINAFAHCFGCHRRLGSNPHEFTDWVKNKLGLQTYETLVELSNDLMLGKQNRREKKEIAAHYKAEYERIMKLRSEGETGRIEVVGY